MVCPAHGLSRLLKWLGVWPLILPMPKSPYECSPQDLLTGSLLPCWSIWWPFKSEPGCVAWGTGGSARNVSGLLYIYWNLHCRRSWRALTCQGERNCVQVFCSQSRGILEMYWQPELLVLCLTYVSSWSHHLDMYVLLLVSMRVWMCECIKSSCWEIL